MMIAMNEEEIEKLLEGIDFQNLTAEQITGEGGLLKLFTRRIIQKAMIIRHPRIVPRTNNGHRLKHMPIQPE